MFPPGLKLCTCFRYKLLTHTDPQNLIVCLYLCSAYPVGVPETDPFSSGSPLPDHRFSFGK